MNQESLQTTRRYFLGQCTGVSVGAMALQSLLAQGAETSAIGLPHFPHFGPTAKRAL